MGLPKKSGITYINKNSFAAKANKPKKPKAEVLENNLPVEPDPDHFVKPQGKLEKTVNVKIKVSARGKAAKSELKQVEDQIASNIQKHFDGQAGDPGQEPDHISTFPGSNKTLEEMPEGFKEAFSLYENTFKHVIKRHSLPFVDVVLYDDNMNVHSILLEGFKELAHAEFFLDPDLNQSMIKNEAIRTANNFNIHLPTEETPDGKPSGVVEDSNGQLRIDVDEIDPATDEVRSLVKYDQLSFFPKKQGSLIRLFVPEEKNHKKEEKCLTIFVTEYAQYGNNAIIKIGQTELTKDNLRMLYERFDELQDMV